ncbi:MAG: FAD-dependent oxidoreductase [Deltaproteobacteria bacterium]
MVAFSHLFSPARVGGKLVKNRLVMAPMLTGFAGLDGEVNQSLIDYYLERALGGVGIIIVEAACIDQPAGLETFHQLKLDHPRHISSLENLSRTIANHGARSFIQIFHAGRQTSQFITGVQPVAPSPVACPVTREVPRELTITEIEDVTERFIRGASYAAMAGFDGVELHAAHGYLINQFLSPHSNNRNDRYGGSLDNRMRLLLDIIRGIKANDPGLLLSVRINIDDFVDGGLVPEESLVICQQMEAAGVDLIHCSVGTYESGLTSIEPSSYPEAWRAYLSEKVKKAVNVPVVGGGMIRNPQTAEDVIAKGQADFVFLGRSLLADPHWPVKAREGKVEDIRPCISCNHCFSSNSKGLAVSCTVNPWVGNEARELPRRAKPVRQERVDVIGGGPAGMQAAIALDKLGFAVSLYEREDRLGGLLNLASLPPHKDDLEKLNQYLIRQVEHSSAEVHLNTQYEIGRLSEARPDHIVVATGSKTRTPKIDGWDPTFCWSVDQVLRQEVSLKGKRILIIGGGRSGCEVADYLLGDSNEITVVELDRFLAATMEKKNRRSLMNRLEEGGVKRLLSAQVLEVDHQQASIKIEHGQVVSLGIDTVIGAAGFTPLNDLFFQIGQQHGSTFLIGDAFQVNGIKQALDQGEMLARHLYRTRGGNGI